MMQQNMKNCQRLKYREFASISISQRISQSFLLKRLHLETRFTLIFESAFSLADKIASRPRALNRIFLRGKLVSKIEGGDALVGNPGDPTLIPGVGEVLSSVARAVRQHKRD